MQDLLIMHTRMDERCSSRAAACGRPPATGTSDMQLTHVCKTAAFCFQSGLPALQARTAIDQHVEALRGQA